MDPILRKAIDGELNAWGRWIEVRIDRDGYASASAFISAMEGRGGGMPGHKILCDDMPSHIYAVHGRWLLLPEHERDAVWVWYVVRVKPDGTIWPIEHKCRRAGITEEALRQRVCRARYRIAGLPVNPLRRSHKSANVQAVCEVVT